LLTGVAVEKGTKAVISVIFSVDGERTFNNLRMNFAAEIPRKEFFNSDRRLHSQPKQGHKIPGGASIWKKLKRPSTIWIARTPPN
jgi:hypothetical protein